MPILDYGAIIYMHASTVKPRDDIYFRFITVLCKARLDRLTSQLNDAAPTCFLFIYKALIGKLPNFSSLNCSAH